MSLNVKKKTCHTLNYRSIDLFKNVCHNSFLSLTENTSLFWPLRLHVITCICSVTNLPRVWCHYMDFQWPGGWRVIKSQTALMVLVSLHKAARRWWEPLFTHSHWIWTPLLVLNRTSCVCHFWPQTRGVHFFMSRGRVPPEEHRSLILQHLLGVVLFKIVFLRPTPRRIKIYIVFSWNK